MNRCLDVKDHGIVKDVAVTEPQGGQKREYDVTVTLNLKSEVWNHRRRRESLSGREVVRDCQGRRRHEPSKAEVFVVADTRV